jgi:hypothetical protein
VSREAHAGFCERRRVRLPPPTLLQIVAPGAELQGRNAAAWIDVFLRAFPDLR